MKIEEIVNKLQNTINDGFLNDREKAIINNIIEDLKQVKETTEKTKILLVEDNSINLVEDREKIERLGYEIVVYRQGSAIPQELKGKSNG